MFDACKTQAESKKLYHRLAQKLHPDFGGDHDLMVILNTSYERHINLLQTWDKCQKKAEETCENRYQKEYEDIDEGDPRLEILDEIFEYASRRPKFDPAFINSIKEFIEENGHITSSQYNRLVNVYYSFKMDKHSKKAKTES